MPIEFRRKSDYKCLLKIKRLLKCLLTRIQELSNSGMECKQYSLIQGSRLFLSLGIAFNKSDQTAEFSPDTKRW